MWKIIKTTDNQHVGKLIDSDIQVGHTIQLDHDDKMFIESVVHCNNELIAFNPNYQITLSKEY